jgi:hypothetical protein
MNKFGMAVVAGLGAMAMSFAALPAAAATLTFDFTASGGSVTGSGTSIVRTYSQGTAPNQVTLVARGLNIGTSSSSTFQAAQLGYYGGYGLGVCNASEGTNCSSPSHQVDNSTNGVDFVFMQLNPAAQINSITVRAYSSTDTDVLYYLGNTANPLDLVGKKISDLAGLGFTATDTVNGPYGSGQTNIVTLNTTQSYNSLLIGAPLGQTNDGFKIRSVIIDYTTPPSGGPVPEPMAFAIFGMGLIGLRAATRRRRTA